ncbi:MAG TPA: M36 family metallopeptidase [Blastocatellia bacterium]|nr:M36 family metallopeptidase [Blastocatellia bacterium]
MTKGSLSRAASRRLVVVALVVFALLAVASFHPGRTGAVGAQKAKLQKPGNFDVRVNGGPALGALVQDRTTARSKAQISTESMRSAASQLRSSSPDVTVRFSSVMGGAEIVESKTGALTHPAPGQEGMTITRRFLHAQAGVYGLKPAEIDQLHFIGESVSPKNGLRMVRFEQVVNGIPVFQSETRAILDREGRLIRTLGLLVPGADSADSLDGLMSPEQSLASAMATVGITLDVSAMTSKPRDAAGNRRLVSANHPKVNGPADSRLVYFPLAPGTLIPAWSHVVFTRDSRDWYMLVDARTGALLWRKNIRADASTQDARFNVYVQGDGKTPAENPAPATSVVTPGSGTQFPGIARTTVSMSSVQNLVASPDGWIDDGGNTTTGNNVDSYLDVNDLNMPNPGLLDDNGRPVGNVDVNSHMRDFLGTGYAYTPPPLSGNPDAGTAPTDTQFQRGAITELFYISNWYHDQLYNLGFDEAAGNFQTNNFGRGGTGGDPVLAEGQDGSGTDNSNFSTPPDGMSGRMQMYIFDFPTPNRDGILDSEIVAHELTHGVSNRLIGNGNGLIWDIGGGMGEGWSDFYALSLLHNSNAFNPDAQYPMAPYCTYQLLGLTDNYVYGIRRFPYSTDNTVNPLTWADVDDVTINLSGGIAASPIPFGNGGALEVHNTGEVWCLSLWEMRSRIIKDPAGANGDVPTGNATSLQLVTDALKMTPINPSFTDARDAILAADLATNAGANENSIWQAFADRGLGYKAVAPLGQVGVLGSGAQVGIGESFSVPYLDATSVTIDDSTGNNNGGADPGEPVNLNVQLFNPWRSASHGVASATAVLTATSPGATVVTGNATYGAIGANQTVAGTPFKVMISPSATCGQSISFNVQTTSTLGVTNTTFSIRVGEVSGVGAPVTYTRTIPGGLAIPDDNLNGVTDTQTITDDLQISSLQFRIDELDHTFTGDLTVSLKAPNGYGTDMAYVRGLFIGDGDGDNFINTVFDDNSSNDLNLSGSADAPFTGAWTPAFNSTIWALFGIPNLGPDPVGQLGRLDGLSTKGVWSVHVTDEAEADTGTLHTWSVIVTPVAYTCQPFACTSMVLSPSTIPAGTLNVPYPATQIMQTGGTGTITFSIISGTLPAGMTLSSGGLLSGTPAQPAVNRSITIKAVATGGCTGTITVVLNVLPATDICLQDPSTHDLFKFSSTTGGYEYIRCSTGVTLIGTGVLSTASGLITVTDNKTDRRVQASFNKGQLTGTATITFLYAGGLSQTFKINSTNPHPTCSCPVGSPPLH